MMTETIHQKISPKRRFSVSARPARRPQSRREKQSRMKSLRNFPRGFFRRGLDALSRPGKLLLQKILQNRLAAKAGWGCAAGFLLVLLFYFVTGSLVPALRGRHLELSLPGSLQPAVIFNSYIETPAPDSPPEENGQPFIQAAAENGGEPETPAAPAEAPLPAAASGILRVQTRRVRSGETVSGIAAAAGLNLDTLISFNRIQDVRKVPAGAQLKLPNQNGMLYIVKRGDSLGAIARTYAVSANTIADVNDLESETIHPEQELFIPGVRMKSAELKKILGDIFIRPVSGTETRLTSPFGMRADPFTGVPRVHNGLDLAGAEGTHIFASRAGKVVKIGIHATYGNFIIISHEDGYQSWYAHLLKALVKEGKTVAQGQLIAEMGSTGYSTGPHLHFSIFKDGSPIDPMKFLR